MGIGVIGLGFMNQKVHLPALAAIRNARVVAVSDALSMEKASATADRYGAKAYAKYEDLIRDEEVEAVVDTQNGPKSPKILFWRER